MDPMDSQVCQDFQACPVTRALQVSQDLLVHLLNEVKTGETDWTDYQVS